MNVDISTRVSSGENIKNKRKTGHKRRCDVKVLWSTLFQSFCIIIEFFLYQHYFIRCDLW